MSLRERIEARLDRHGVSRTAESVFPSDQIARRHALVTHRDTQCNAAESWDGVPDSRPEKVLVGNRQDPRAWCCRGVGVPRVQQINPRRKKREARGQRFVRQVIDRDSRAGIAQLNRLVDRRRRVEGVAVPVIRLVTFGFPVGTFSENPIWMFWRDSVGGRHTQNLAPTDMSPKPVLSVTPLVR